jgi:hypothetical protein
VSQQLSQLVFNDHLSEALVAEDAKRWEVECPGGLEVWATMCPASALGERFQARLCWPVYPDQPPSLKFRDPATGRIDLPSAWPQVRGFRPPSLDACVTWCAEGFGLHPEWRNDLRYRWDPTGNPLLRILRTLQDELDNNYQGRFQG